ncbi:hypothetical protein [Rhizobium yanglingense]
MSLRLSPIITMLRASMPPARSIVPSQVLRIGFADRKGVAAGDGGEIDR